MCLRWYLILGYYPRKIFENSDAKSCMVTTCSEMSCFLKTTAKKLGDQNIVSTVVAPMAFKYISLFIWECDDVDNTSNEWNNEH